MAWIPTDQSLKVELAKLNDYTITLEPLFAPKPETEDKWSWQLLPNGANTAITTTVDLEKVESGTFSVHAPIAHAKKHNILLITTEGFHKVIEHIPHPGAYYSVARQPKWGSPNYKGSPNYNPFEPDNGTMETMRFRFSHKDENDFLVYKEDYY